MEGREGGMEGRIEGDYVVSLILGSGRPKRGEEGGGGGDLLLVVCASGVYI